MRSPVQARWRAGSSCGGMTTSLVVLAFLAAGCSEPPGEGAQTEAREIGPKQFAGIASVTVPQTPLLGVNIPMFVDQVPTFNGLRQDGTVTINLNTEEVQQRVLPASVYAQLPAPYNAGTYVWAYNLNGAGATWPARTIESRRHIATTAIYTNSLVNTKLQSLLTVDQSIHWADPLNLTHSNNCINPPPFGPPDVRWKCSCGANRPGSSISPSICCTTDRMQRMLRRKFLCVWRRGFHRFGARAHSAPGPIELRSKCSTASAVAPKPW
jgi:hypothetical protein